MIWCHRSQWALYLRIQYSWNLEITILSYKWKKTLEKEDLADLQNSQMSEDSMKEILTWWGKIPVLNWRQLATAIFLPTGFFSAMWLKSVNFQHFFSLLLLLLHLLILFPLHSFPACFPLLLSSDLLIPSLPFAQVLDWTICTSVKIYTIDVERDVALVFLPHRFWIGKCLDRNDIPAAELLHAEPWSRSGFVPGYPQQILLTSHSQW